VVFEWIGEGWNEHLGFLDDLGTGQKGNYPVGCQTKSKLILVMGIILLLQ